MGILVRARIKLKKWKFPIAVTVRQDKYRCQQFWAFGEHGWVSYGGLARDDQGRWIEKASVGVLVMQLPLLRNYGESDRGSNWSKDGGATIETD